MTHDDLGLFGQQDDTLPAPRAGGRRAARALREQQRRRRKRRHRIVLAIAMVGFVLIGAIGYFGVRELLTLRDVPDYPGAGVGDVVIRVEQGDSTSAIAATLVEQDVVAGAAAFIRAAEGASGIRGVQPGYYQLRSRMSGESAVTLLLDSAARVGQLEIRAGVQLDDVGLPDGSTVPGVLSRISQAGCARLNATDTCVSPNQLRAAIVETDPATLGVPGWAAAAVARVPDFRRVEGLIAPGNYDVRPGSTAVELMQQVLATSSAFFQSVGMPTVAEDAGLDPYPVLVIASIVEREGIERDFGKVSQVIYNRLSDGMPLQMDSTINYPLDRQEVTTADGDRARSGPYNTYLNPGLPPTPIGAPSDEAIAAAVTPEVGPWQYFVKCETDGTSCFTVTIEEHRAAVASAQARGIF